MHRIKAGLAQDLHSFQNHALWAACCMGLFVFLCCSEFVAPDSATFDPQGHRCLADITYIYNETCNHIEIQSKASKSDQFWQGTKVALGAMGTSICPVLALLDLLTVRGSWGGGGFIH